MADYRVNVYEYREEFDDVIARVRYNRNLDYWNGKNNCSGEVGEHKGITKLKDGRYVIIIGSDWEGKKDFAYTVSDKEALDEILKSGNIELLEKVKYKTLKELYESSLIQEEEE